MSNTSRIAIKEIHARVICPICEGRGCYDCANKGYTKEWIPFIDLVYDLAHKMAEEGL